MANAASHNLLRSNPGESARGGLFGNHGAFLILLAVYIVFNLLTLTSYPIVADDEGFLANWGYLLARNGIPIIDPNMSYHGFFKDIAVLPLSGIFFYGSLALLGDLLGFGLFAMRLQPLIFAVCTLVFTYMTALVLFEDSKKALLTAFLVASSAQFLVMAHTVRQESMFTANIIGVFLLLAVGVKRHSRLPMLAAAFLIGAAICIHPNGVILPLVFCVFLMTIRKQWGKGFSSLFFQMTFFVLLGGLLFLFFDYLPGKDHYWQYFHSPQMDGLTNKYQKFFSSFFQLGQDLARTVWKHYWGTAYHRFMFYLILHFGAVLSALYFATPSHKMCLTIIALLILVLWPMHFNIKYMGYTVPFFSLLLGSVLLEWKKVLDRKHSALASTALCTLFAASLALPLLTVYVHRGYDHLALPKKIVAAIQPGQKFIAASAFFFGLPHETHFSQYIIMRSGLKQVMSDSRIPYFVLDPISFIWLGSDGANDKYVSENMAFLSESCDALMTSKSYVPGWRSPGLTGFNVTVFDCRRGVFQ